MFFTRHNGLLRIAVASSLPRRGISKTKELPYTKHEESLVLTELNNSSAEELKKFIGAMVLKRLMKHREENGAFESLEDVISKAGVLHRYVVQFSNKILSLNSSTAIASAIMPRLDRERCQDIVTVASVNLDPPFTSYVKMNVDGEVRDWGRFRFLEEDLPAKKKGLNYCYNMAARIYRKLPQADIFVTENQYERVRTPGLSEKEMLRAILYTMISFGEPEQPKAVQMHSDAVARYFGLKMGPDRISCQDLFRELIRSQTIKIHPQVTPRYEQLTRSDQEFLGVSTLYCLAFLKATEKLREAEKKSLS